MNDTRYEILEKDALTKKLRNDSDFLLLVVRAFCRSIGAKDILDEDSQLNDKFTDIVDKVTERRYYRNAQIGIATFTKLLLKNSEDAASVKMCKEAISALDSIKKSCHHKGSVGKKDVDEFREAMKALGV